MKRVECLTCHVRTADTFEAKWKHTARRHPELLIEKILPMIFQPQQLRETGFRFAEVLKNRLAAR